MSMNHVIGDLLKSGDVVEIAFKSGLISEEVAKNMMHDCGSIQRILISSINTAKENVK